MPFALDRTALAPRFRSALWIAPLWIIGCSAGLPVSFQGQPGAPIARPEEVVEVAELPPSATPLGQLYAHCKPLRAWEAFEGRSLVDVDCTAARLHRMLRESTAEHGGNLLASLKCDGDGGIVCRAVVGRDALGGQRVRASFQPSADVRGLLGAAVRIDFSPELRQAQPGASREEDSVRDVPALPPSHRVLGSIATRCKACEELSARDALRIAVGRLGGTDAVAVSCQRWDDGYRCAGRAAIAERDPDPVAN